MSSTVRIVGFNPVIPESCESGSQTTQTKSPHLPSSLQTSESAGSNSSAILSPIRRKAIVIKPSEDRSVCKLPVILEWPFHQAAPISHEAAINISLAKTAASIKLKDTLAAGMSHIHVCKVNSIQKQVIRKGPPEKFPLPNVKISLLNQETCNPNKYPIPSKFYLTLYRNMHVCRKNNKSYTRHTRFLAKNDINSLTSLLNYSCYAYSVAARVFRQGNSFVTLGSESIDEMTGIKKKEKILVPSVKNIQWIELNACITDRNTSFLPVYLLKAGHWCMIAAFSGDGSRLGVQLRAARNVDRLIPIFRYRVLNNVSKEPSGKAWKTAETVYVYIQELLPLSDVSIPDNDPYKQKLSSEYAKSLTLIDGSEVLLKINPV